MQPLYAPRTHFLSGRSMAERGICRGGEGHRSVIAQRKESLDFSNRVFLVIYNSNCFFTSWGPDGRDKLKVLRVEQAPIGKPKRGLSVPKLETSGKRT
jgi:hypothetical protein